jgi:hypothetical protein
VRWLHAVRTSLSLCGSTEINCVTVTALLAIVEDEAIDADTFFINHVIDHGIYMIPAQLLLFLVCRAISDNGHFTTRVVADRNGGGSKGCLGIVAELIHTSLEGDAGKCADTLCTTRRRRRCNRFTIIRAETFSYAVSINILLAISGGD